jgi:hypothetical protein
MTTKPSTTTQTRELGPCPFPMAHVVELGVSGFLMPEGWVVKCLDCGLRIRADDRSAAIAIWNTRADTEQVIRLDHALRLALSRAQVDRMMELQRQGFTGTIYEAWERGLMPEEYRPAWELLQPKAETELEQEKP